MDRHSKKYWPWERSMWHHRPCPSIGNPCSYTRETCNISTTIKVRSFWTCSAASWQFLWDIVIRKLHFFDIERESENLSRCFVRRQKSQQGAGGADEDVVAHDEHLHASEDLRICWEAGVETSWWPECRVFREQWLGGERLGYADGTSVHKEPWHYNLEERLPWCLDEHNGTYRLLYLWEVYASFINRRR